MMVTALHRCSRSLSPFRILCVVGALGVVGAVTACGTQAVPGDNRLPRCEARQSTDPARLNIDSLAEGFGAQTPCAATLILYVASNSTLRALDGEARFLGAEDDVVREAAFSARLDDNGAGMWARDVALPAVTDHNCRSLRLEIVSLRCRNDDGQGIDCPAIRLKTSMVLEDLALADEGLKVCFDD